MWDVGIAGSGSMHDVMVPASWDVLGLPPHSELPSINLIKFIAFCSASFQPMLLSTFTVDMCMCAFLLIPLEKAP